MEIVRYNNLVFAECSAITSCFNGDENERVPALFMWDSRDEFHNGDCVVFNWQMPQNEQEAFQLCEEAGSDVDDYEEDCAVLFDGCMTLDEFKETCHEYMKGE